jgi:hypothetical protein
VGSSKRGILMIPVKALKSSEGWIMSKVLHFPQSRENVKNVGDSAFLRKTPYIVHIMVVS